MGRKDDTPSAPIKKQFMFNKKIKPTDKKRYKEVYREHKF